MPVRHISINGFRNLKRLELDFDPEASFFAFVGANGQGKTNVMELIYLCALSKSFRTRKNEELIGFEADFCSIKLDTGEQTLEFIVTKTPPRKVLKVNGVKKTALEFIGHLKAVFFSPDDLAYMAMAPKLRRRYLDVLLSQMDQDYLDHLMRYESARKQRNALLRKIKEGAASVDQLHFWDGQLAEHGLSILMSREMLLSDLQPLLCSHYQAISHSDDQVKIFYETEFTELKTIETYLKALADQQGYDIISGKTHFGPHRDDLRFELNGNNMRSFSSRGEWRSMVLALKFAELELLERGGGQKPILLLDDVFSELDHQRQKYLIQAVKGYQSFITNTHHEFIEVLEGVKVVFGVERGVVRGC